MAANLASLVGADLAIGDPAIKCPAAVEESFRGLPLHDYLCVLQTIGVAATVPATEDPPARPETRNYYKGKRSIELDISTAIERIERAVEVMGDWPRAYWNLLEKVASRNFSDRNGAVGVTPLSTSIGRSMLYPMLGINGLPIGILCEEVRKFCIEKLNVSRHRRALTVQNVLARRMAPYLTITALSQAVGTFDNQPVLRRIYVHTLNAVSNEELQLDDSALATLIKQRVTALHRRSANALSACAAGRQLEGGYGGRPLIGWEHPDLLPRDEGLSSVQRNFIYDADTVEEALARLRRVVIHAKDVSGLASLRGIGMRRQLAPYYRKTDLLLDIFRQTIPVYANIDVPILGDLYIDLGVLRRRIILHRFLEAPDAPPFAYYNLVNSVLTAVVGPSASLARRDFKRLRKDKMVRFELVERPSQRGRPHARARYHVRDVLEYVTRDRSQRAVGSGADMANA